jgi:hypothetical protein
MDPWYTIFWRLPVLTCVHAVCVYVCACADSTYFSSAVDMICVRQPGHYCKAINEAAILDFRADHSSPI